MTGKVRIQPGNNAMKMTPDQLTRWIMRSCLAGKVRRMICSAGFLMALGVHAALAQRADIVIANFEGVNYGDWKLSGTAFGTGPACNLAP